MNVIISEKWLKFFNAGDLVASAGFATVGLYICYLGVPFLGITHLILAGAVLENRSHRIKKRELLIEIERLKTELENYGLAK